MDRLICRKPHFTCTIKFVSIIIVFEQMLCMSPAHTIHDPLGPFSRDGALQLQQLVVRPLETISQCESAGRARIGRWVGEWVAEDQQTRKQGNRKTERTLKKINQGAAQAADIQ